MEEEKAKLDEAAMMAAFVDEGRGTGDGPEDVCEVKEVDEDGELR